MASTKKINFFDTEAGERAKDMLIVMVNDTAYNTASTYSANLDTYPDNRIPFVDKHMSYLKAHPAIQPEQYISNLRLMTRIR